MSSELNLWIKKILILILILALGYILYTIQSLVLMILISGFITMLISPLIDLLEKYHIHASFTILGVYLIIIIIGLIVIGTIIPIIIKYFTDTVTTIIDWTNNAQEIYTANGIAGFHLHPYIERGILFLFDEKNIDHTLSIIKDNAGNIQSVITKQLSNVTSGGLAIISSVSGTFLNWILIAVMTFLMALERRSIAHFVIDIVPDNIEQYLVKHFREIQKTLNTWIRAMLILSFSIFFLTYIGLTLVELISGFDTGKTFTLAIIGGVMEFIPYLGPIIALIPALIIGLGLGWKAALAILILYVVIQQTENNILVPYVMSRSLDLSPFLVFIVMLIGATLGGILGIILAVPMAAICRVIYVNYRRESSEPPPESKLPHETLERIAERWKKREKKLTK